MLDPFDYKEPSCPLSDGKKFYYPSADDPKGEIPVRRIIEKLDAFYAKNDTAGAGEFLCRWEKEAVELRDKRGELSIVNELMGHYRKEGMRGEALDAAGRGEALVSELDLSDTVSGATVLLNAATVYKAFGMPEEAVRLYASASRVYRRDLGEFDIKLAGLCNNSALALCDLGRYDEAEELFAEAAAIMAAAPRGGCDEAATYVNMAHMYETRYGREDARVDECMSAAWQILDSENTERDSYYAFVSSKCAPSYEHFGDTEKAKILKERSDAIYERA